ncbi:MAG TPA: 16S rRNA (guanine(527)-N(7))-methyltransferase RsmG [Rubricoccaceae bacterium]|jgi:16S rRNA (guanine527-N7)-methyltransferase
MSLPDLFAALTDAQRVTLSAYGAELARVNRAVNLVAPSTVRDIPERHIRHSLALAVRDFPAGATVVDWGSGGGLPAVPLAIRFPDVQFVAVDSVGKKTEAVRLFARRLGLANLSVWNGRAEAYAGPPPTHAVSRATAPLADLWQWFDAARVPFEAPLPAGAWLPGLTCLKGGDLTDETAALLAAFPDVRVETTGLGEILGTRWADKALVSAV